MEMEVPELAEQMKNLNQWKRAQQQCRALVENCLKSVDLGFLGLAAEECGDVEVVGRNVMNGFADVLLHLMDDIGHR
jgi:hypothetical protein